MNEIFDELYRIFGSYSKVAQELQYSDRQLRNIRLKIKERKSISPRVELWIRTRFEQIKKDYIEKFISE